jgi:ubiquitin carboxyl-terminal hydrolase 5/13
MPICDTIIRLLTCFSCYMASVMQTLFSLPSFQARYFPTSSKHWESCPETLPADCVDCQMHKFADGLLSGRYSHPSKHHEVVANPLAHDSPTPVFQEGVRPAGFKALVGKGHEEFSTMRQQDSEEFFTHLLKVLRRSLKKSSTPAANSDPTTVFSFGMEQRLQCGDCKKVRYRVDGTDVVSVAVPAVEKSKDAGGKVSYEGVLLTDCLDSLLGVEALEYTCPSCAKNVIAQKLVSFLAAFLIY